MTRFRWILPVLGCVTSCGATAWAETATMSTPGVAAVVDLSTSHQAELPSAEAMRNDPAGATRSLREAGFRVSTDPTGRCIGATSPPKVPEKFLKENRPLSLLAAGVVERMTAEQYNSRRKGFLEVGKFSPVQQSALWTIARQYYLDRYGKLKPGVTLGTQIWSEWTASVITDTGGQFVCRRLAWQGYRPPDPKETETTPLAGSPFWYSWPHAASDWGEETISIKGGRRTVTELASYVSRNSRLRVSVPPTDGKRPIAVFAEDVPVRKLLWAIEMATGLQVQVTQDPDATSVSFSPIDQPNLPYSGWRNIFLPIPGLGHYSALDSTGGRTLLALNPRDRKESGPRWYVWRLRDLPPPWRQRVPELWEQACKMDERSAPQLDEENTYVLWTRSIYLAVQTQYPDGSGGGSVEAQYWFPAIE